MCVRCLRTVILLSPCHLTLNATSPSFYLSIMLSQSLTGRIRAVHAEICACVCGCGKTAFVVFTLDPHFLSAQGLRRVEGFQVMCVSVLLQPCHPRSAESRLPVDYRCHHLSEIQLSLILSCLQVSIFERQGHSSIATGGQLAKASILDLLRESGSCSDKWKWQEHTHFFSFHVHELLILFLLLNHPSPGKTKDMGQAPTKEAYTRLEREDQK